MSRKQDALWGIQKKPLLLLQQNKISVVNKIRINQSMQNTQYIGYARTRTKTG